MDSRSVLLISSYVEPTRTLVRIADALRQAVDVEPIALITATGARRPPAVAAAQALGVPVIEELTDRDEAISVEASKYNPFQRARRLRAAFIELSDRILKQHRPLGILCTRDFAGGHFLRLAKERGIESLYVQWTEIHTLKYYRAWWNAVARWSDRRYPLHVLVRRKVRRALERLAGLGPVWPNSAPATCLAVPGRFHREMCIRAGVPADRVEVTGNVQCDDMYNCAHYDDRRIAAIRTSLGLPGHHPFLLYAPEHVAALTHLSPVSARRAIEMTLKAMQAAFPTLPRVVKVHPQYGEGDAERAQIQSIDPDAHVVSSGADIGDLVAAAGLVVSTLSSSLLWAIGIDRPAIRPYFWTGVDEQRLPGYYAGAEEVDTFDGLVTALRRSLEDAEHIELWRQRRAQCRDAFLVVDGKSVERIVRKFSSFLPGELALPSVMQPGARAPTPTRLPASQSG